MSLLIHIYYTGKNDAARRFADEMIQSGIVEKIRSESGNFRYEYFFPLDDPTTVLLIDEWENQAALDQHHALPLMKEIAAFREKYDLHMKVERYVTDVSDMPSSDEKFIRK